MSTDGARILVVDDDVPIRELLVSLLTENGYAVIEAAHGAAALDVLSDTTVDLVISDIMMPLLDGVRLCRQVKATWQIAVILMSSAPQQHVISCRGRCLHRQAVRPRTARTRRRNRPLVQRNWRYLVS